jgi:hypothetical protein
MAKMTDYLEIEILDHITGVGAWASPDGLEVALHSAVCSDAAPGTEQGGTGYSRQPAVFSAAAGGATANTGAISFTATAADWDQTLASSLYSNGASTPASQYLFLDNDLTDTDVGNGDTLQFAIGDIDITMD